jgi:hypothetical protein
LAFATIFAALTLFLLQAQNYGFVRGHHGWVSSHNLANLASTTPENLLVGHSLQFESRGEGDSIRKEYLYFFRNSFVGNAIQHALLFSFDMPVKVRVMLARYMMDAVNVAALALLIHLLTRLGVPSWHAAAAGLLGFSGLYAMTYNDLIAPDGLTLLAVVLAIWGIYGYKSEGRRGRLAWTAFVGVSLGWGYAVLPIFGIWWLYETLTTLRARGREGLREALFSPPTLVLASALALTVFFLIYAIWVESVRTGIPMAQSEIIVSARRRLGFDPSIVRGKDAGMPWGEFLWKQLLRIQRSLIPYSVRNVAVLKLVAKGLTACGLIGVVSVLRRGSESSRLIWILLLASGPAWLWPMKGFSAFHDYSAVMYLASLVALVAAAIHRLPQTWGPPLMLIGGLAFMTSAGSANYDKTRMASSTGANLITEDMDAIAARVPKGARVYIERGYRRLVTGAPYSFGFFMTDRFITNVEHSDWYIARRKNIPGVNLTPENNYIFLFQQDKAFVGPMGEWVVAPSSY